MRFTESDIKELARRIMAITKRDSEFAPAVVPFDGSERFPVIQYIAAVQDFENRLLPLATLRNMIIGDPEDTSLGCLLTVSCTIPNSVIKINGTTRSTYDGFYGQIVLVEVSASGYDTWFNSVSLTEDTTLSISLNQAVDNSLSQTIEQIQSDIAGLEDAIEALPDEFPDVSLVNNGNYYTLTVDDTSVDFYSKAQMDALLAGLGRESVTTEDPEEEYLHFSRPEVTLPSSGEKNEETYVDSNVDWEISDKDIPDEENAQTNPEGNKAYNINCDRIILKVGQAFEIKEIN